MQKQCLQPDLTSVLRVHQQAEQSRSVCRDRQACNLWRARSARRVLLHWAAEVRKQQQEGWQEQLAWSHWKETLLLKAIEGWRQVCYTEIMSCCRAGLKPPLWL